VLQWAAPPRERVQRNELDLNPDPLRPVDLLTGPCEASSQKVIPECSPRQWSHQILVPTTSANNTSGSGRQLSILSPAAENSSATLARSYLLLISVLTDSPSSK
jgi:hypothetical protein